MTETTPTHSDSLEAADSPESLPEEIGSTSSDAPESSPAELLPKPPVFPVQFWSVLILAAFVLGLGAGYLVWARPLATAKEQLAAAEQRASEAEQQVAVAEQAAAEAAAADTESGAADQKVQRYPVPEDDDPVLGSSDAPITIIEFSDYECPYCQRWHQEAWPQIQAKYGDQIRLIFRDFPLESIHPNAAPAAEAANCAGEQDQYYAFNDLLFTGGKSLGTETYETYAQQLDMNLESFQKCVAERRYQSEVQDDLTYASELGVRSTPTFFINGLAVVGAQPFEVFEQVIDMELAGEIPQ